MDDAGFKGDRGPRERCNDVIIIVNFNYSNE